MRVIKTLRLFRFFGRWSAEELFSLLGQYEPILDGRDFGRSYYRRSREWSM